MDNNSCAKRTKIETTKKACDWYQNLSKEEKEKKHQCSCEQYKTILEHEHENPPGWVWKKVLQNL